MTAPIKIIRKYFKKIDIKKLRRERWIFFNQDLYKAMLKPFHKVDKEGNRILVEPKSACTDELVDQYMKADYPKHVSIYRNSEGRYGYQRVKKKN